MSQTTSPPAQIPLVASYKPGSLANYDLDTQAIEDGGQGALAKGFKPAGGQYGNIINIRYNYPWTLTPVKDRTDIPTIILKEYKQLEGNLKEQIGLFSSVLSNKVGFSGAYSSPLEIYDSIWEKNTQTATKFVYLFPYFNDIAYSMGTASWQKLDDIGPQISNAANEFAGMLGDVGFKGTEKVIKGVVKGAQTANSLADVVLKYRYPSVGVADRPKMFAGHTERTITIDFPLFNTIQKEDWRKNLDFIQLFASQNLYNKRDFITGTPPVWYEVEVPGQYFCWAACVTDFTVKNLGNIHSVGKLQSYQSAGNDNSTVPAGLYGLNVPDAYQVTITLQEMTQPSKNQYDRVIQTTRNDFVE